MSATQKISTAVLLSGSGRTLGNFLEKIADGRLPISIDAVVSSRADVRGVTLAQDAGIATAVFKRRDYPDVAAHNQAVNGWLQPVAPRLILLAGYLCFYIRPDWFTGRILNIHPALLPLYGGKGYYGDRVHKAVLEAGDNESGCTVHEVSEVYDDGLILGQKRVPVLPQDTVDTLAARVFAAECDLYPQVVADVAAGMLD
jgi:phosphoribosylglycinamide formyltransferase 1